MNKLVIQITQKPPKQAQLAAAKVRLQRQAWAMLIACLCMALIFFAIYVVDTPPTGKAARYAAARTIDWWMVSTIGLSLLFAVGYTKTQFALQLLQPITKDGVKMLRKIGLAQPKVASYLNLVSKEGRELVEAEAKTCLLFAEGHINYVEKI